jgi:hypothetical protein
MNHQFDTAHAKQYGIPEAILINNFQWWITKNRANGVHFHDGRTWTYNTVLAFQVQFDYMTIKQVRRALDSLIEAGVLVKADLNHGSAKRTLWYAFADETRFLEPLNQLPKKANAIAQNEGAFAQKGKSTNRTDSKQDIQHTDSDAPPAQAESASTEIAVIVHENLPPVEQVFAHWQAVMQIPRAKLDAKRRAAVQARIKDGYTADDLMLAVDGCRKSEWHMGKNDKNKAFNDIELICRDASRVDGFIAQAHQTPAQGGNSDADWQGYLQRRQQRLAGNDPYTIDMEA